MQKRQKKHAGFTLVEVLVALMIGAIVLTAAATMAGAMSCAKEANDRMNRSTAYLLQVQTYFSDLIMRANGVTIDLGKTCLTLQYDTDSDGVNDKDVIISKDGSSEIITITEDGIVTNYVYRCKDQNGQYQDAQSNVLFDYDGNKLVTLKFDLTENGVAQTYQICSALRGK